MLSPAKINLSLRIIGKRPDGFHEIDTLITQLPGLADDITAEPAPEFSFTCSDPTLPTDSSNLVVKAAQALSETSGKPIPFRIHLEKIIPHSAGLGGGSSNAATTLLLLNDLIGSPLTLDQLHTLAANLGSDIPFFLYEGTARCTGRGEIVRTAPPAPHLPIILFKPQFPIHTPDAYHNCLNAQPLPGIHYTPQLIENLTLQNDLEKPVFAKHRYLAELKNWLSKNRSTQAVLMSGSGSTIFAILRPKSDPDRLTKAIHKHFDPTLWSWHGTL